MYKISANTLFTGQHLVFVPECHSTNSLVSELASQSIVSEGTVVITSHQTAGRGQRGNRWETAGGLNLTFSVLFRPTFLSIKDQFYLTIVTSLAIADLLKGHHVPAVKIKWPNDVLVDRRKCCGILIENTIQKENLQQSIVGIGLNVNQENFTVPAATSLSIAQGQHFDLNKVLNELLENLEKRYLQLRAGKLADLKSEYLANLFGLGELRGFTSRDITFEGVIKGVSETGELIVEVNNEKRNYNFKEISFHAP